MILLNQMHFLSCSTSRDSFTFSLQSCDQQLTSTTLEPTVCAHVEFRCGLLFQQPGHFFFSSLTALQSGCSNDGQQRSAESSLPDDNNTFRHPRLHQRKKFPISSDTSRKYIGQVLPTPRLEVSISTLLPSADFPGQNRTQDPSSSLLLGNVSSECLGWRRGGERGEGALGCFSNSEKTLDTTLMAAHLFCCPA